MANKILVVDDEPKIVRFVSYALKAEGYEVITAQSGQEALDKVTAEQPNLVILDVMLPEMNGLDICDALRNRSETTALPIIMFSAKTQVSDKLAGLQAGADEYLTKPIDPAELVGRVGALLARSTRLRQSALLELERDKIISAQEEVRRALSRNLHDGTVQKLAAISMQLDYVKQLFNLDPNAANNEIADIQDLVHKASKEARLTLFELRPVILETQGIVPALVRYVEQLNEDKSLEIRVDLAPVPPLDTKVASTIFSIVQEAINNAKRHAKAKRITLTAKLDEGQLLVSVRDNGVGFDVEKTQASYADRNNMCLLNMKERAHLIDGTLTIASKTIGPAKGTVVRLSVPVKDGAAKAAAKIETER
jgi:signal transduction histidine kinase